MRREQHTASPGGLQIVEDLPATSLDPDHLRQVVKLVIRRTREIPEVPGRYLKHPYRLLPKPGLINAASVHVHQVINDIAPVTERTPVEQVAYPVADEISHA